MLLKDCLMDFYGDPYRLVRYQNDNGEITEEEFLKGIIHAVVCERKGIARRLLGMEKYSDSEFRQKTIKIGEYLLEGGIDDAECDCHE